MAPHASAPHPAAVFPGHRVVAFYGNRPLMSEADVLGLRPRPLFILYQ